MKISTLGLCLLMAGALAAASGCSKRDTDTAAESANTAPAEPESAPAPGPESAAPRAAGAPPSGDTTAAAQGATGTDAATASGSGAQTFQTYCATCHGATGKGDGPVAAGLNPKPAAFAANGFRLDPTGNGKKGELDDIKAVVRDGAAKYGGSPLMAPWPMLTAEQLQAVAEHVRSLSGA